MENCINPKQRASANASVDAREMVNFQDMIVPCGLYIVLEKIIMKRIGKINKLFFL